jgi:hypothetical protein
MYLVRVYSRGLSVSLESVLGLQRCSMIASRSDSILIPLTRSSIIFRLLEMFP